MRAGADCLIKSEVKQGHTRQEMRNKISWWSLLMYYQQELHLKRNSVAVPSSRLVRRNGPRWLVAKDISSPSLVICLGKPAGKQNMICSLIKKQNKTKQNPRLFFYADNYTLQVCPSKCFCQLLETNVLLTYCLHHRLFSTRPISVRTDGHAVEVCFCFLSQDECQIKTRCSFRG